MDLDRIYPALSYLRRDCKGRVPRFVWEYLDSGTGDEVAPRLNAEALDRVRLTPDILGGAPEPDLSVELFGRRYAMPVGMSPVGMSGLVRPEAELMLARTARREGLAYCLSTVAAMTPEEVGPHVGDQGWFQLYPPRDPEIRRDLLARAKGAGFHTLVLTVDLNTASRRERMTRAGISQPMRITPKIVLQAAIHPAWSLARLAHGMPRLKTLAKYTDVQTVRSGTAHAGYMLRTAPDWDYLAALRDEWDGPLLVKGVMDAAPVKRLIAAGVDGIWVSNHGGRQFDAVRAAIEALPEIRAEAGPDLPLVFDGGVRSGTDVIRAVALGADMVMLGRGWHWGVGAAGQAGADQVAHILRAGMVADLGQMGIARPLEARGRVA
jgi:isopentenyl diphosphate isomerase/L-lactate dehydrogenase-like FMN-dependent dehydrogenase